MPFHCLQVKFDRLTKDQLLCWRAEAPRPRRPRAQSFTLCLACVSFVSWKFLPLSILQSLSPSLCLLLTRSLPSLSFPYLGHAELGYLSISLLTTSYSPSIHPPRLSQGTGSRWISLGAKYTVCMLESLPMRLWWCHFLKSVYCFCVSGEIGVGSFTALSFTVCGDCFCWFLCLMAKRFLCRAPNFLFSPLCLLSLSSFRVFVPFF